ncbi:MAG: hypothetical protein ABSH24_11035 [Bryobacteraceae bacterium]|jgi:hypothetical protein
MSAAAQPKAVIAKGKGSRTVREASSIGASEEVRHDGLYIRVAAPDCISHML